MMKHQKKRFFGIFFFMIIILTTFLIKNIVGATIDVLGNTITGTNINTTNIANYSVTMQFSGTLDSGDSVVIELIDASIHSISGTYISTGSSETTITIHFDTTTLSEGIVTLSGSIFDSGLALITGGITTTVLLDITTPTFIGVTSGAYYSGDQAITFSDTNLSGATLNGNEYTSGTTITGEGTYTFVVTDLVGNATGATFTIDKTEPTFAGILSGSYYSGNVTITFNNTATVNGTTINSGDTISLDGTYEFIATDLAGNSTGAIFTIDTTNPAITNITTGQYFSGNVTPTITEIHYSGATLNASDYTSGTAITGEGIWEIIIYDLAGNSGAKTFTIDKSQPSFTGILSGSYYSGSQTITFSDTNLSGATLNGSPYTSGTIISSEGTYIFTVTDLAGNSTGATFTIDTIHPTTTASPNGSTGRVDVSVTLTPIDTGAGVEFTYYCIDTANTCTPNTTGTSTTVTGTSNSITTKYIRFHSIDKSYNTETINSARFYIDKETPLLTGTTTFSSNNSTNTGYAKVGDTITVLFQSHETLIGTPTMIISGGTSTGLITNIGGNNYSGTYVMKITDVQGTIGFNILMTDLVGNTGTTFTGSTIIFDRTVPAGISITNPTNTTYFQGGTTRTITWNTGTEINFGAQPLVLEYSNDGRSTLHSIISTGTTNDGSYNRTFPVVDSTLASVRIIATDLAGNTATFTGNLFTLDSTAPTDVTITFPSGGEFFKGGSGYIITWSGGTDNFLSGKTIEYSTNGFFPGTTIYTDTMNSFSYAWTTPSINSSGVKLKITVIDRAGLNKVAETAAFYIDSTAPTAIVFTDANSNRRKISATATGTSTDALAGLRATGVVYKTDSAFTGTCNGGTTLPPTFTTDGYRTGYACVMDKAGNIRTGQQSYKIDTTAPLLNMGSDITTNTGRSTSITVTGDISGISGYTWTKLSGTGTISFSSSTTQNPTVTGSGDGTYILQVVVKDNANNSTTGTMNFTRHTIAPNLSGSTVSVSNQTATFIFTGNEAGSVAYSGTCGTGSLLTSISGSNTTTFTLANATYSGCQLKVTDSAGNTSSWLSIPTFTINYTAPSGGGGGGGGGGIATCLDSQLMCVNGKYQAKTGVLCRGGKTNSVCADICVDGDYSGDPNDGLCKDATKVEASTGVTSTGKWVRFSSPFDEELTNAYFYAYTIKITTVADIKWANMTGVLIRSHLAKMMSEYAIKVLGKTPDTTRSCIFSDMSTQTEEFQKYAITACQLGLMGLKTDGTPAAKFDPNDQVNRAIFGTTLSRALRGEAYNGGQNWYEKHLEALKDKSIVTVIDKPFNRELRGYVMLMMMRSDKNITKSSYLNFTSLRGTTTFVPNATGTTTTSQFTTTELNFIKNINKTYQFTEGYTAGQVSAGVKYLQYFLKAKQYYTGSINGTNTTATVNALFKYQSDNEIVTDENDTGAGYLGPTTREIINPLLTALLNP